MAMAAVGVGEERGAPVNPSVAVAVGGAGRALVCVFKERLAVDNAVAN